MENLVVRLGRDFEYKNGNIYRKSNVKNKLVTTFIIMVVVYLLLLLLEFLTTDMSIVAYVISLVLTAFVSLSATPFKYEIIFDLKARKLVCAHKKFESSFSSIEFITSISAVNNNLENVLGDMMNVLTVGKRLKTFYVLLEFGDNKALYLFRGKKVQCELIRKTLVEILNNK